MQRRRPGKLIVLSTLCVVVAVAIGAIVVRASDPLRSKARRRWKDQAVATIAGRVADKAWVDAEVARVRKGPTSSLGHWFSDDLLLTKNGDWIACESVCAKEQASPVTKDLFIGRGSDGKWYYSTFHFCVGKVVLAMEPQPDSLSDLAESFWLVPFDGKSDECLNVTWDGGPYGEERKPPATKIDNADEHRRIPSSN